MPVQINRRGKEFAGKGDGVTINYHVGVTHGGEELVVALHKPERVSEFMEIMNRALSTWETPPEWAVDLMDKLTDTPSPQQPVDRPIPEINKALWGSKEPDDARKTA